MGKQMPLLFLAGNKFDLSHMRVVKPEAHTKLAASKSMEDFYVSAKTGDSVHEMFVKVAGDLAGVVISKPSIKEVGTLRLSLGGSKGDPSRDYQP